LVAAFLVAGRMLAIHFEQTHFPAVAPEVFPQKNQGLAFQRVAAHAANILPGYGSSELAIGPVAERAAQFFSRAPTGFQLSVVAKPGASSLTILEKIAALGRDWRGRKIVISISPSWFLSPGVTPERYATNFSPFAANALAFGSGVDLDFKREMAARMLEFPRTLTKRPLLKFALQRLASPHWLDRLAYGAIWPLGKMHQTVLDVQDHFGALVHVLWERRHIPALHESRPLNWEELITRASSRISSRGSEGERSPEAETPTTAGSNANFRRLMNTTREWSDFDLLLRALATLHARPLLISTPICARCYGKSGVSSAARDIYYEKLRALARQYDFPLVDFAEHDTDPAFLDPQGYHLSAKGWIFYNRALDAFFHDTLPSSLSAWQQTGH
jgi:D-alanine transfer protein